MLDEENKNCSEEQIVARHRLEEKQLLAKTLQLKKSVNKDKKRKKEIIEEIATLEKDLRSRHLAELAEFNVSENEEANCLSNKLENAEVCSSDEEKENQTQTGGEKLSKTERRRQKKAEASKEREAMIKEAEKLNKFSTRNIEAERMKEILKGRNLNMVEINPDGNCMYAAVAHQMGSGYSVADLRSRAGHFIRTNADDFAPFITDPKSGNILTPVQFEEYCHLLENTSAWGGQPELRALSQVLQKRIEVLQAEGVPIIFGEEFDSRNGVLLAYYRHYYGLGEHYNSVAFLKSSSSET